MFTLTEVLWICLAWGLMNWIGGRWLLLRQIERWLGEDKDA